MLNDFKFSIATCTHRRDTRFRNQVVTWAALVNKLSQTQRTAETVQQYAAADKQRQSEIKDVGGFVGGYLNNGIRNKTSVLHRTLLTLDADFATPSFWTDFQLRFDNAACAYSTHKHTREAPRYRLVIPLNRTVDMDEYQAIGRWVANELGIETFDKTTFAAERLMYWPSTPRDGEYFFKDQDGPALDADWVLGQYTNWQDVSSWPMHPGETAALAQEMKQVTDPRERPGLVGAFCRAFTMREAVSTFLSDFYEPTNLENRFSYKFGSSYGGMIVYDDLFAYSHHATDPASGQLCNAFDLVRLHKFGREDDSCRDTTPIQNRPSTKAMLTLVGELPEVREIIAQDRQKKIVSFFGPCGADSAPVIEEVKEVSTEWMQRLEVDNKGNIQSTINNIVIILENDPRLKGLYKHDIFREREFATRDLPWRKLKAGEESITDADEAALRHYLEIGYKITGKEKIKDARARVLLDHQVHPVREYLQSLPTWDGIPRADTLLIDWLNAEDTPYTRAVTRKQLLAMVYRIFRPGIKHDEMVVLAGPQGCGKSTLLNRIAVGYHSDNISTVHNSKEAGEQLQGVWLAEMGELVALRKAEAEAIKRYLSATSDDYRGAYKEKKEYRPRQTVFWGTTNDMGFLSGDEDYRRFRPVAVSGPYKLQDLTDEYIKQMWAEVYQAYLDGEKLQLSESIIEKLREQQALHEEENVQIAQIAEYLKVLLPDNWEELTPYQRQLYISNPERHREEGKIKREYISAAEVWVELFNEKLSQCTTNRSKSICTIFRKLKLEKKGRLQVKYYGKTTCFSIPDNL